MPLYVVLIVLYVVVCVALIVVVLLQSGKGGGLSGIFGKRPERPKVQSPPITRVDTQPAQQSKDDLLRRMSRLRRATVTSQLSEANVKRRTLGAG